MRQKNEEYNLKGEYWASKHCCGITLDWDDGAQALTISMPGYVQKMLILVSNMKCPKAISFCHTYQVQPRKFDENSDQPLQVADSFKLDKNARK